MMCSLIEELQINCVKSDQSCETWVVLGSQPGSSFCGPIKCVTLLEEEYPVVTDSFWKK